MMVSNTVLRDEPSERTQRTIPGYASWALSQTGIDRMSKGLVAYEVLHLTYSEYNDALSRHEAVLLKQLDDEAGVSAREMLDGIVMVRESTARTNLIAECEYEPPEEPMQADLHLPSEFVDTLPKYAVSDHLEHAIVYAEASPWTSRLDRMDDLQDLLLWTQGQEPEEPSAFVEAVISGESEKWAVDRLHDRLSPEVEPFERSDLTNNDLNEWGTDIKQVPAARAQALQTALSNMDGLCTGKLVRSYATTYFDDVSEETAHKYADRVNLELVNENVEVIDLDVTTLIDRLVDEAYESASVDSIREIERMEDFEIAGFDDDPRELGGPLPPDMAGNNLDEIEALLTDGFGPLTSSNRVTADNSEKAAEWIQVKRAEVAEKVEA